MEEFLRMYGYISLINYTKHFLCIAICRLPVYISMRQIYVLRAVKHLLMQNLKYVTNMTHR